MKAISLWLISVVDLKNKFACPQIDKIEIDFHMFTLYLMTIIKQLKYQS